MKRRNDIIYASLLILFLIAAAFIRNDIIKGMMLFLFSAILIVNTTIKLIQSKADSIRKKFFYGILLFLEAVLALGSLYVIIAGMIS